MNAPMISRRHFTAGLGGILVAFSLDPKVAFAQQQEDLLDQVDD